VAIKTKYKENKLTLKKLITREKENSWKKLCDNLENDIWGKGYKIACAKLATKPRPYLDKHTQILEYKKPFPAHPISKWNEIRLNPDFTAKVTTDEFKTVIKNLKNKKAPGPNNITAEIIKKVASNTSFLDQMVNEPLRNKRNIPTHMENHKSD